MKERITRSAFQLLVENGLRGTSYGQIARRVGTTTTNIHHHFGNKDDLVTTVLTDYVTSSLERHRSNWLDASTTLEQKVLSAYEFNKERYELFNAKGSGYKPWSLIGRLRLEADALPQPAREQLQTFTNELRGMIRSAVELAREKGELLPDADTIAIALLLGHLVNSSAAFTQDAGGIENLRDTFRVTLQVIEAAYGHEARTA